MAWREHAPVGQPCWCGQTYPVKYQGQVVGMATPLEDGSYAVNFSVDESTVDINQIIIEEPIQGELFTMEESA